MTITTTTQNQKRTNRMLSLYAVPVFALALVACDSRTQLSPVEKAQQNLMNVRAQAAQDVQAAEKRLSDVIVSTEEKVSQARSTLNRSTDQTRTEGSLSGSTSPADATPPTPRAR